MRKCCGGQDGGLALTAGGDTKNSPHTPDLLLPAWVEHMKINYISQQVFGLLSERAGSFILVSEHMK